MTGVATKRARRAESRSKTEEPVNVARLRDLASRKAADRVCWPGSRESVRAVLLSFLARVVDGLLPVEWKEGASAEECGFKTRRFSVQSLFVLPRALRSAGRCGLWNTVDVDQENCHFRAQLARHPARPALAKYVSERAEVLGEVQEAAGVGRDAAKALFLRLAYGGSVDAWRKAEGVQESRVLPAFVDAFASEQAAIRGEDAEKHPELMRAPGVKDAERPEVTLQSRLNERREREILDAMERAVGGLAVVGAYEHDGLFLYTTRFRADDEEAGRKWRQEVLAAIRAAVSEPVAIKEPGSFEDSLRDLRARWPDEDWESEEALPLDQVRLVGEAMAEGFRPVHQLFAQIVALEAQAWPGSPHAVRDVFKHLSKGEYLHWEPGAAKWFMDDGRDRLLHVICEVLQRRLRSMEWTPSVNGGRMEASHGEAPWQLAEVGLVEKVERLLRPLLRDRDFRLDHDRRYLVFENKAYDTVQDAWVALSPAIRASRSTGWAWFPGLDDEQEARARNALESVGLEDAAVSEEACAALETVRLEVPALGFLFGICGESWERTLYLCKHLSRAVFALPYQEVLWTRGPGSNGKDTLANLMASLLGGYFANLPCEALTGGREMDAPSQTLLNLKGKRFVAVREIARNAKIRSHIYKTIADPKGALKARGLYGRDEEFPPHFLLYLASNVPVDIDDSSGGSARRTRILDLPNNYVEAPLAANERQRDATIEDRFEAWRPSLFLLLRLIYLRFLRERPQSNITPVPQEVTEAVEEELQEEWMHLLAAFVRERLRPATGAQDASNAAEVREAFFQFAGVVPKKEVGLRLARKGFAETLVAYTVAFKRTTKRVYKLLLGEAVVVVALKAA